MESELLTALIIITACQESVKAYGRDPVSNLNSILRGLERENGSFAVITNYQFSDIEETTFPILIRNTQYFSQFNGNTSRKHEPKSDRLFDFDIMDNCVPSKSVDAPKFLELWNGKIQIEMFPQEHHLSYTARYCYREAKRRSSKRKYQLPFAFKSVNILISNYAESQDLLAEWMDGTRPIYAYYEIYGSLYQQIFLKLDVPMDGNGIGRIRLLKPSNYKSIELRRMTISEFRKQDIWKLTSDMYASYPWTGFWMPEGRRFWMPDNKMLRGITKYMHICNRSKGLVQLIADEDNDLKYYSRIGMLLLEIMRNKSYYMSPDTVCDNGVTKYVEAANHSMSWDYKYDPSLPRISVQRVSKTECRMQHQLSIESNLPTLRFIAPGVRGIQAISFRELHNIYERRVWLSILGSILLMSVISVGARIDKFVTNSRAQFQRKWFQNILPFFRILLEQRDPFPPKVSGTTLIRWLLSGFILSSIVLSRAYKGTNVYNILKSRPLLMYDRLDQLIKDNFYIYSRISTFRVRITKPKPGKFLRMEPHEARVGYSFEPILEARIEVSEMVREERYEIRKKISEQEEQFYGYSHMLWQVGTLMENIRKNLTILDYALKNESKSKREAVEKEIVDNFFLQERELLFQELTSGFHAGRAAIILPESQCNLYAKRLKEIGMPYVSIGTENYGEMSIAVNAGNYAPFDTLERIQRLKESGIPEWLPGLDAAGNIVNQEERHLPKPPTMQGNIVVIFIVLAVGCLVGTGSFVFENFTGA